MFTNSNIQGNGDGGVWCEAKRPDFVEDGMQAPPALLDLREIARFQGESARVGSGLAEGEVLASTSREDKLLPAEIIRSGDGGALRKSSLETTPRLSGFKLGILTEPEPIGNPYLMTDSFGTTNTNSTDQDSELAISFRDRQGV